VVLTARLERAILLKIRRSKDLGQRAEMSASSREVANLTRGAFDFNLVALPIGPRSRECTAPFRIVDSVKAAPRKASRELANLARGAFELDPSNILGDPRRQMQEVWKIIRAKNIRKLKAVLRERRAELQGKLDTPDTSSPDHDTALTMCCEINFREGVKLLLSEGARVNATTGLRGYTALYTAAQFGFAKLVRILLAHGASIDLADNEGATALHIAAEDGNLEVVSLLMKMGADLDHSRNDGCTPLQLAAQNNRSNVVNLFISHEAQLNLVNNQGFNPLHTAAFNDHPEVCAILIAAGLDPAIQDSNGWTALSHYGHFLDDNDPEDWDGVDDDTRPRLTDVEKRDRVAEVVAARSAFLLDEKREENWQRRAAFMHALVGSGLRLTAAQQAEHAAFQAAMDYAAPIPPVPVYRLGDILGNEGFVRMIASYV